MWKSGGVKAEAAAGAAARPRLRGWQRALMFVVAFGAMIVFVFPQEFDPGVEAPEDLEFGNPSSVVVNIGNQNVTPLHDVEYACELVNLTLANGSTVTNARELVRGSLKKIPSRRAIAARCEAAYILVEPVKTAEYKLTITYRAWPWPQRRASQYRIVAQVNQAGQVTGWKVK